MATVFDEQDIPRQVVGQPDIYLPYTDVCALYERGARLLGEPLFGALCGAQWRFDQLGALAEYAASAPTLDRCLKRLITAIHLYESGSSGCIERQGDLVTFSYFPGFTHPLGRNHFADANLGLILDIVRYYKGPDWLPIRLGTDNPKNRTTSSLEEFHKAPVEYGQKALSLSFTVGDLGSPNPVAGPVGKTLTLFDVGTLLKVNPPESITESITEIVRMRLLAALSDIDGAARHLRLGVRTLQRRLAEEGANYRTIVATERCRRAIDLLNGTGLSITEISLSLGYEHAPDFARAFTLCCGHPPSKIRRFKSISNQ